MVYGRLVLERYFFKKPLSGFEVGQRQSAAAVDNFGFSVDNLRPPAATKC